MYDDAQHTRKLMKREKDRKSQKRSRERTKSRIAQLESMVENLRQNESKAQLASLMDQLGQVTRERDGLLSVLDSLGATIRRHLGDSATDEPASDTRSEPSTHAPAGRPEPLLLGKRIIPVAATTTRMSLETAGSTTLQVPMDPSPSDPFAYNGWDYTASIAPYHMAIAFDNSAAMRDWGKAME
ncbi:hypothetical protein FACUT_9401 [Fusarium acutatum]|uniref:BZIP domain-containing protein n=1 Tax=Fusarium acutatum TaxID=78861 RepID=A0A8H4NMY9_9HYPO|nr:hypothetical protein FACUT_9401 [Fusarium acutatum]